MKFTKRFSGSYYAVLSTGEEVTIQTMQQYTWEYDVDQDGNKWVLSFDNDDGNCDRQMRAKTKADLVAWLDKHYN